MKSYQTLLNQISSNLNQTSMSTYKLLNNLNILSEMTDYYKSTQPEFKLGNIDFSSLSAIVLMYAINMKDDLNYIVFDYEAKYNCLTVGDLTKIQLHSFPYPHKKQLVFELLRDLSRRKDYDIANLLLYMNSNALPDNTVLIDAKKLLETDDARLIQSRSIGLMLSQDVSLDAESYGFLYHQMKINELHSANIDSDKNLSLLNSKWEKQQLEKNIVNSTTGRAFKV